MLIGLYRHTLDNKGRAVIPLRFRGDLGDRFVITRGLDGCLSLYPMAEWERLAERIRSAPLAEGRTLQRFFFSNAEEAEPDAQGRIVLSSELRALGGLDREIVIIGVDSRAEIWDAEAWERTSSKVTEDDLISALSKSGV